MRPQSDLFNLVMSLSRPSHDDFNMRNIKKIVEKAVTACLHLMNCIHFSTYCCTAASSVKIGSATTYASLSQTKLGNP